MVLCPPPQVLKVPYSPYQSPLEVTVAVLGGSCGEAIGFLHYLRLINHRHYGPVTIEGVSTIDNKNAFYLLASYSSQMGSPDGIISSGVTAALVEDAVLVPTPFVAVTVQV